MRRRSTDRIVAKIVFPAADLAASSRFYEAIGLDVECYDDGYAWVRHRGDEVLHLAAVTDLDVAANRAAGYWHVQDADAWHGRCADVDPGPLQTQPWGMREFVLRDPSGNLLRVGQNV